MIEICENRSSIIIAFQILTFYIAMEAQQVPANTKVTFVLEAGALQTTDHSIGLTYELKVDIPRTT